MALKNPDLIALPIYMTVNELNLLYRILEADDDTNESESLTEIKKMLTNKARISLTCFLIASSIKNELYEKGDLSQKLLERLQKMVNLLPEEYEPILRDISKKTE